MRTLVRAGLEGPAGHLPGAGDRPHPSWPAAALLGLSNEPVYPEWTRQRWQRWNEA